MLFLRFFSEIIFFVSSECFLPKKLFFSPVLDLFHSVNLLETSGLFIPFFEFAILSLCLSTPYLIKEAYSLTCHLHPNLW